MQIEELKSLFSHHPEIASANRELEKGKDVHLLLSGLYASARALALAHIRMPLFVVLDHAEAAQYLYSDLRSLTADADRPLPLIDRSADRPASPDGSPISTSRTMRGTPASAQKDSR